MAKNIFLAILLIAPTIFSAETKGGMPQLNPESFSSQIFWLVTLFAILFIFIHFFFFPKLIKIRQEREKTVENYLQKANEINDSVNKIVEKMRKDFENAKNEQNITLKEAFDNNKKILDQKILEINEEFDEKKNKLNTQIENNKEKILSELPEICVKLSDDLYEKIMKKKSKGSISEFRKLLDEK